MNHSWCKHFDLKHTAGILPWVSQLIWKNCSYLISKAWRIILSKKQWQFSWLWSNNLYIQEWPWQDSLSGTSLHLQKVSLNVAESKNTFFFPLFFLLPPYQGCWYSAGFEASVSWEVGTAYCRFHRINPPKVLIALSPHWMSLDLCFLRIKPHITAWVRLPSVSVVSKSIGNKSKRPQREKSSAGSWGALVYLLSFNFCWQESPVEEERQEKLGSVCGNANR